ncbi:MAG: iron-sulfur cluster assembly scaffold protein [Pseudomonadota bacterium]
MDFSRKGAEIPTFFFYSGFLPRFKHPVLGQVVRQIRGTLSIGIILANLTEMGPLSWFFLRFSWNLKGDEKSKTKAVMIEHLIWLIIAALVLFVIIGLWFGIHYWLTPHIKSPDGKARITGRCGDTMEICLKFNGDRVIQTSHWSDGCAYSLNCVYAATDLARGRTPDEILEVDADLIQESIGGLARDYMHCAQLAAETLHSALHDYMLKQKAQNQ